MATRLRASSETVPMVAVGIIALVVGVLAGKDARIAIGVAAALAFIAVLLANYTVAVGVFFVSAFLQLPGTVAKGIGAVLVLAWVAMIATRSGRHFQDFGSAHKVMAALVLAFVAWTLLGVAWASSPATVLSSLGRYIPDFVVFFVVYAAARKRSSTLTLIAFFVLGGAMAAAYGVIHPPSAAAADSLSRDTGTIGDPNFFAMVLVATLALGLALAMMRSLAPVFRVAAVIACALSVAGILFSLSRGGLVALIVALLTGVLIAGRWRPLMAAIGLLVIVVAAGYFASSPGALQRITESNNGSGRTDIWTVGWRMFKAHPFNGVGAGNFPLVSKDYVLQPGLTTRAKYIITLPKVAHNTYLGILAEGGIPALLLFLAIIVASLRCSQKAWRKFRSSGDEELEFACYAQVAALTGFLAAAFFLSAEYSKQLWILLAFGPLLLRVAMLPAAGERRPSAAPPAAEPGMTPAAQASYLLPTPTTPRPWAL